MIDQGVRRGLDGLLVTDVEGHNNPCNIHEEGLEGVVGQKVAPCPKRDIHFVQILGRFAHEQLGLAVTTRSSPGLGNACSVSSKHGPMEQGMLVTGMSTSTKIVGLNLLLTSHAHRSKSNWGMSIIRSRKSNESK